MIKTLAELKAYFETGDKPTQTEFENLIDSTYRGYKVYTALLTQTGTDAPVATVLENTLGEVPVFNYLSDGVYEISTTSDIFVQLKTIADIKPFYDPNFNTVVVRNDFKIRIYTYDFSGASANDYLSKTPIEIRVYN